MKKSIPFLSIKNKLLSVILALSSFYSIAQNVGINSTGGAPNASAGLDVNFTDKGLLIPRMTTAQRNAIPAPATSLMIFNITTNCFEAYDGATSSWQSMFCFCTTPPIPTATAATAIAGTSFSANWTASAGATTYYLDVSTVNTFASFVPGFNNLNVGNVLTYSVTGLTVNTTYYYRVRAANACGSSGNSNTITLTTTACYVPGSQIFSYTGALQTFTVPCGVTSIIVNAKGAQGGASNGCGSGPGGLGANIIGTFVVTPGQVLNVVVGGQGLGGTYNAGGGGGSFVWLVGPNTLFIAAGGGGGGASYVGAGAVGSATTVPTNGVGIGSAAGGVGGGGGSQGTLCYNSASGSGGGGFTGNGGSSVCGVGGTGGISALGGANGGAGGTFGGAGGYGCGGGSAGNCGAGGGGGGYNGGGGGNGTPASPYWGSGGGGGSFNGGTAQTNTAGTQAGNGQVTITW